MKEIWKPIKEWEGIYEVSNLGRIKTLKRKGQREQINKHAVNNSGYYIVVLSEKSRGKKYASLHRIVAETFIPNPENKPCVNHINRNKLDNRVVNLEWTTFKENTNWSYENIARANREKIKNFKRIKCIETGKTYNSCSDAARDFKCSVSLIADAAKGYHGHHRAKGLTWQIL